MKKVFLFIVSAAILFSCRKAVDTPKELIFEKSLIKDSIESSLLIDNEDSAKIDSNVHSLQNESQ